MNGKFEKIAKSDSRPYAEIRELSEYPFGICVILAQGSIDNLIATVLIGVEDGLVSRLDMCAVPDPTLPTSTLDKEALSVIDYGKMEQLS